MKIPLFFETLEVPVAYDMAKETCHMTLNHHKNPVAPIEADSKPKVLYLDQDQGNLDSFKANFRDQFEIITASYIAQAYGLIESEGIQIAIADHNMQGISGVDFLESLSHDFPHVQRILLTGYTEMVPLVEAINKSRVFGVLTKPLNIREISEMIKDAWNQCKDIFEKEKTIRQLVRQNQQFEFILRQRLLS